MAISNKPPEELDKDSLINVAVALGNIKEATKDKSPVEGLLRVPVEFKANNLGDTILSPDVARRAEQSKADALYYLESQGIINDVTFENKSTKHDFIITIKTYDFEAFNTRVFMRALPYLEELMTQKIKWKSRPSVQPAPKITPMPLPKVLHQLGDDFAVHDQNILSYKGKEINLEAQEAKVLATIMRRSKDGIYTSARYISVEVLKGESDSLKPEAYVRKIVSNGRKAFRTATQSDTNYFEIKHSVGYKFKY